MLINLTKDFKFESPLVGKLFIGTVVANDDPKQLQRIKVSIPNLTGNIPTNHLPWYAIKRPVSQGGSIHTSSFGIPDIGTTVTVMFHSDNIYAGIVDGIIITSQNNQVDTSVRYPEPLQPSDLSFSQQVAQAPYQGNVKEDYPHSYGFIDSILNWFRINKKTKTAEFVHSSGSKLKIDANGNTTIHITGNLKIIVDKDISQSCINRSEAEAGQYYHRTSQNSKEIVQQNKNVEVSANFAESTGGNKLSVTTGNDTIIATRVDINR